MLLWSHHSKHVDPFLIVKAFNKIERYSNGALTDSLLEIKELHEALDFEGTIDGELPHEPTVRKSLPCICSV